MNIPDQPSPSDDPADLVREAARVLPARLAGIEASIQRTNQLLTFIQVLLSMILGLGIGYLFSVIFL